MKNSIVICLLLSITLLCGGRGVGGETKVRDPGQAALDAEVGEFEAHDTTLFGAIARLSGAPLQFSFAFEHILAPNHSSASVPDVRFSIQTENKSVREILSSLCSADGRYTWARDGMTVNVYPKETVDDSSYLMNREIRKLEFRNVLTAEKAMFDAVAQLPPPFEQIAFAQAGGNTSFPAPWTAAFQDLTLRHAMNEIARSIGPRGGWVLSGSRDFRVVGFHDQRIHDTARKSE